MSMVADHMLCLVEYPPPVWEPVAQPTSTTEARHSEAQMLDRLLAGDDAALGLIYDRFAGLVFGLAKSISRDEQIAREVTREVFAHLWEFPDRVDLGRGNLKSYLGMMSHRRAVDAVRRSERNSRTEDRLRNNVESVAPPSDNEVVADSTRIWQRTRIADMLAQLPKDQREAIRLAYFEGRTYRQVAVDLGIPEGTAKSRLRLALASLRSQMNNEDWAWT